MKTVLLLLSWEFLFSVLNNLQAQCLTNGTFAGACTTPLSSTEQTWAADCGDGWIQSNGQPQMIAYTYKNSQGQSVSGISAFMSSVIENNYTYGQGMFTPYTFQQYHTYQVTIMFSTSGTGGVNIYAANGLTQANFVAGVNDNPYPTPTSSQLINTYTGTASGNITQTYQFTATSNYNQLWIYPSSYSTSTYTLQVFSVNLCPYCLTSVNSNDECICSNFAAGNITISSETPGDPVFNVTNSLKSSIFYAASNSIVINQGVIISSNKTAGFTAIIVPCNPANNPTSTASPLDSTSLGVIASGSEIPDSTILTSAAGSSKLKVYPTISTGTFTITGSPTDLNNANIIVVDESGRTVYSMYNVTGTTIPLNLGNLASGFYFVQIRQPNKVSTQKIIIGK